MTSLNKFIANHLEKIVRKENKFEATCRIRVLLGRHIDGEMFLPLVFSNNLEIARSYIQYIQSFVSPENRITAIRDIWYCISHATREMFMLIIDSGIFDNQTILELAVSKNYPDVVRNMIATKSVNTSIKNCELLKIAMGHPDTEILQLLSRTKEIIDYNVPMISEISRDSIEYYFTLLKAPNALPKFRHMSKSSIRSLRNIRQEHYSGKPDGLWGALGNTWIDWCRREMPHWIGDWLYELDVSKLNLFHICDDLSLFIFDKFFTFKSNGNVFVLWEIVQKFCDGIIFADKSLTDVFDHYHIGHWANAMDVPSVCIWNTSNLVINELPVRVNRKTTTSAQESGIPLTKNQKRGLRRKNSQLKLGICV